MEHVNATRMRETVDAFMARDVDRLLEGFAEDAVWIAPGDTPASGTFRGRNGIRRFFAMLDAASKGSIEVDVEDVLAGDRYVTIFLDIAAQRHGELMHVRVAQFGEIDEQGRWRRCWFLPDKLDEWDRFFAVAKSENH